MNLLQRCETQLRQQLVRLSLPRNRQLRVAFEDAELRFQRIDLDATGAPEDIKGASFGWPPELANPEVSDERIALWAEAFLEAQLDETPALGQAAPSLLFRTELDSLHAMLDAMRDLDYALYAQQILEAEGPVEEQILLAVESGNWLWVEALLRAAPTLATTQPEDYESLRELAEQCPEEAGRTRVLEILNRL